MNYLNTSHNPYDFRLCECGNQFYGIVDDICSSCKQKTIKGGQLNAKTSRNRRSTNADSKR